MQLTKENLLADRSVYQDQLRGLQMTLSYIDGLIAYMDKSENDEEPANDNPEEVDTVPDENAS